MPLNEQRILFANEYVKDFNATRAATAAGYSEKTAHVIGSKLLRDPETWALIKGLTQDLLQEVGWDASRTLDEITHRASFDARDLFEDDGSLKRMNDIPIEIRRCIQSMEVVELFQGKGDDKHAIGLLKKVKLTDRDKALEMLAKYHGILKDRISHENPDGTALAPTRIEVVLVDPKEGK